MVMRCGIPAWHVRAGAESAGVGKALLLLTQSKRIERAALDLRQARLIHFSLSVRGSE